MALNQHRDQGRISLLALVTQCHYVLLNLVILETVLNLGHVIVLNFKLTFYVM